MIFREYDIRGLVGKEINDDLVKGFARAVATYIPGEIVVGMDNRTHSEHFKDILVKELLKAGRSVLDIGIVTTPMFYFAVRTSDSENGVMVTASHNPKEYNGFKMVKEGAALYGAEIQRVREIMESGKFSAQEKRGELKYWDIKREYTRQFYGFELARQLKVVIDCGNGTAGVIAPELLKRYGTDLVSLYETLDGTFPNHEADPVKERNMKDLMDAVLKEGADIGFGFDGDADRLGVVDDKGRLIPGDLVLLYLAQELAGRIENPQVLFEVKSSRILSQGLEKLGAIPVMYKTGHSLIKAKMKAEKIPLAGEVSGHFFFEEIGYYDDAVYAAFKVMEILAESREKFSAFIDSLPKMYVSPEIRVECPDEVKFKVVDIVRERLQKYKLVTIDGVRVEFDDGWGLVRASNTEPSLVLRFEAETLNRLESIKNLIETEVEYGKSRALSEAGQTAKRGA
ncbi:phosphomannomutase/phosphoglucomutase [Candidatus Woesearchaeota archaeon]|nr:phosphomannomutase/phosphoglucomutase [Candidatus Woesearchaeota archaeon]